MATTLEKQTTANMVVGGGAAVGLGADGSSSASLTVRLIMQGKVRRFPLILPYSSTYNISI